MQQTQFATLIAAQVGKGAVKNIVAHVQSQDGTLDFASAAGLAHVASGVPMTVDTPYCIASVSKLYTVALIMRLYEQGLIDLDQPISAYLPAPLLEGIHVHHGRDYSQQLTVAQLVSQTSGLPDYFEDKPKGGQSLDEAFQAGAPDRGYSTPELMAITRSIPAKFAPAAHDGKKAHYADTNYHLLGAIIEAVTGQTYAAAVEQMICAPLGLRHTYALTAERVQSEPKFATIYAQDRALDLPLFLASHGAEGGIIATTRENLTFLRAFFDGKLFDAQHFTRMTRQWNSIFFPIQYAYGIMRFKMPRILSPFQPMPELIGHSGSTGSFAFYSPARALYMVGTLNQTNAPSKPFRLMLQIMSAIK